jgi:acyl-CoA synthetase (AMP-forming)/AMP-acid ligase II
MLLCGNDEESVAAYVGFLRRGAVPMLTSHAMNRELLSGIKEAYRPSYIFLRSKDRPAGSEQLCSVGKYSLISTGYEIDYVVHPDLALLLTTSGSTGSPKLVRLSHRNIISNTESIIEYLKIKPDDRAITTLPMHYTYGLSIINTHLSAGATLILTNGTLMDRSLWDALKKHRATTFGGVPYTYEILKKLRFERMDLPHLRYITQAGGKLSPELSAEFADICAHKGIKFIVMYGQTEATARMSYLPWEYARSKAGSVGIAIPGGKFTLKDDEGRQISESGVSGELIYSGENVTLGYAENRFDLSKGDERGGVLETGDMAKFDEDHFFYIVGRKKRFLKLFGNRVNLDETERLLKNVGFDCACSGCDDNLKIFVTSSDIDGVRRYILKNTDINPGGFSVVYLDEIPRNSAGKVLYSELDRSTFMANV